MTMSYVLHRATIALHTPLGTPLAGDTLFGQLCWALRDAAGSDALGKALEGYTQGKPWLVVSDGFPAGCLPRPTLPQVFEPERKPEERKAAKKKHWLPAVRSTEPMRKLLADGLQTDAEAYGQVPVATSQSHNTLNRLSGTTGKGEFAPYTQMQTFHAAGQRIDIYLVIDTARTSAEQVTQLLAAVGAAGFGRDASIGLGKFSVETVAPCSLPGHPKSTAYCTLAPCAPQGQGFENERSYWKVLTRFGRHGNAHALSGTPFKTPVLMATTGAVFTPAGPFAPRAFIGNGLGGDGTLSKAQPATVHQGYAPVVPILLEALS